MSLESVKYWNNSPERVHQRFYIALCLLFSTIQDTFLGKRELLGNNLNWSATCSYYGMVHAGRLLTFIACGDFPAGHADLRKLFSVNLNSLQHNNDNQINFNWLWGFTGDKTYKLSEDGKGLKKRILDYYSDFDVETVETRLNQYGNILSPACHLRNDCNYESLLIAHEYEHQSMSSAFKNLAEQMSTGASFAMCLARDCFLNFTEKDSDLDPDRAGYYTFLNGYLQEQLANAITRKLFYNSNLITDLKNIISSLKKQTSVTDDSKIVEAITSTAFSGLFGSKNALMKKFTDEILILQSTVSGL